MAKFISEEVERVIADCLVSGFDDRTINYREEASLVNKAKNNDEQAIEAIFSRYQDVVIFKARNFHLPGGDYQDLFQAGQCGLWKAICNFNFSLKKSFSTFAQLCIHREIVNAVKRAVRLKHGPLNFALSFSQSISRQNNGNDGILLDSIVDASVGGNPELLFSREFGKNGSAFKIIRDRGVLSNFELQIFYRAYVLGDSQREIFLECKRKRRNIKVKSIDNALQRAKRKIRDSFTLEDFEI